VSGRVLIAPADAPIEAADAIRFPDGLVFEVDGEVGRWSGSLTDLDHIEVALRRVTG
jgi:hypothetical protein